MKDFLQKIVSAIIADPSKLVIESTQNNGITTYTIFVPENEIGKVIGKDGKVISAIRCLARLKALKNQERVLIKVAK